MEYYNPVKKNFIYVLDEYSKKFYNSYNNVISTEGLFDYSGSSKEIHIFEIEKYEQIIEEIESDENNN